jgi:predicted ATPase
LPAKASLRDLGEHRLRDLTRPEQVYQLTAPGLQPDFPALLSLDALPNNLPLQVTSFVGREHEIAEITELIGKNRIVTLVGSGGVGKTRVSLQVAANLLDGSGDGVWFIELAPLSDGAYIPWTIAQALGLTLPSDTDPIGHLVRALKFKRLLLVLDNCEHLVDSAARVIAAIHRGCPNVHVVASSRQSLGIAGEETFRLPSLETPPDGRALHAVDALRSASIALFVERARAGDKRFELTDNNAAIVADICRRLDGIPLAIELAASRVKLLSPRQLRDRLDERFRVLTGGSRDVLPRQQTLRALIDWSYDLLDVRERALFRRLGVFVNGFSLEGAVAVGGGDGLDELGVFDVLASLVDKSLVLVEPDEDRVRYRLLESTRAYAAEKNEAAGERELLAERDLRYFRDRVLELQDRRNRAGYDAEFDRFVAAELEDIRAALDAGLGGAGMADGAAMLAALGYFWVPAGFDSEGVARGERFLAAVPAHDHVLNARLATTVSINLFMTGKTPAPWNWRGTRSRKRGRAEIVSYSRPHSGCLR